VGGQRSLFTVHEPAAGQPPAEIDVSVEGGGSVWTSADTHQISRTAARDRVVWAQFDQCDKPETAGIYQARIRGPKRATEPTRILGAFRPRAAVIHVPRRAAPRAVDEVR
jgi:hypothetical protein